jgi:uroporphyrinogen III methyltransferase / synthase
MATGIVSFVGLGPGDPALHTARAADRIARADVVAHGLPGDDATTPARLVALARAGQRVACALPGAGLESPSAIEALREVARAGVAFEVVPGLGAGEVAMAFAGVVGGGAAPRAVRVAATQVARAVEGEAADAPVTLIADAGDPSQRVLVTTAGRAAERASALGDAELVVAFGAPDDDLRWFERRPLFGKRVLVTRARDQAAGTAALLRDQGARPLVVPTIEIHPPGDPAPLARAIGVLRAGGYGWAVFTSENGVVRTWDALAAAGGDARAFGAARLAAIGPATAGALERHGLRADVVAKEFRGEGLAEAMLSAIAAQPDGPGRVLVARAARARDVLPDSLRAAGCRVDVVAAYETRPAPPEAAEALAGELEAGRVDAALFTSSSTVDNLCDLLGSERAVALLGRVIVASIGPVTSEAARARGLKVDVTAATYTVPGLIGALADAARDGFDRAPAKPGGGSR